MNLKNIFSNNYELIPKLCYEQKTSIANIYAMFFSLSFIPAECGA